MSIYIKKPVKCVYFQIFIKYKSTVDTIGTIYQFPDTVALNSLLIVIYTGRNSMSVCTTGCDQEKLPFSEFNLGHIHYVSRYI